MWIFQENQVLEIPGSNEAKDEIPFFVISLDGMKDYITLGCYEDLTLTLIYMTQYAIQYCSSESNLREKF